MGIKTSSVMAMFLLLLAFVLDVVAFSTPTWVSGNISVFGKVWYGLWQACYEVLGDCSEINIDQTTDWEKSVVAMEILGLLFLAVSCVLAGVGTFLLETNKRLVAIVTGVCAVTSGCFILIGVIVFGAEYDDTYIQLSWAYVLAILAAFASIASGILFIINSVPLRIAAL